MYRKVIGTILITVVLSLGLVSKAQAFVDVRNHWSEAVVEHLETRGLINGYPDGRFAPARNISRAEMCRLLTEMLNGEDEAATLKRLTPVFPDTAGHWASGDINFLYEKGIVVGDETGLFHPEALLRRNEAIVMLLRALKVQAADDKNNLGTFTDAADVPEYAVGYIARSIKDGFMQGYPDHTLRSGASITRAELAVLIDRGLSYQGNEYQFWGQLLQVDRLNNQARIAIKGKTEIWVPLSSNLRVYNSEGRAVSLYAIGLPYNIYFDLDEEGKLAYARALASDPASDYQIDTRQPISSGNQTDQIEANDSSLSLYEGTEKLSNTNYILQNQETSIDTSKTDMRVPELTAATQANGRDVLVAVIDTGIDPGHPDLQITSDGQRKLVDFIDYTDEGKVTLPNTVIVSAGWAYGGIKTDLSRVRSVSGRVKIGYWDEARYDSSSILSDFNGNGHSGDKVLVVAADREKAGVYDTVYVDSNGNGDIRDEMPLSIYRDSKQYAVFPTPDGWGFDYVLSSLAVDGSSAQFGFDSQGHGTHVAGIIAAHGQMEGLAPDARLVVIKVAGSDGTASPQALEQGLNKAAEMGAQIVNVSMGTPGHPELADTINQLSKQYGTIFSVAVGNEGPGLGTVTSPATANEALRVGAYVSPTLWQVNYGWTTKQPTLWYFSSAGPRQDGALGPQIVAPGSVYSTTPLWQKTKYKLDEGTSMAAPHLSGGLALLMDAVMRENLVVTPGNIKRSLYVSADAIPGYTLVEQGYGAVNLWAAYKAYSDLGNVPQLIPAVEDINTDDNSGLYARDYSPGSVPVTVSNRDRKEYNLVLSSGISSVKVEQERLLIPGQSSRSFDLQYDLPEQPGLYTGFINADDANTPGVDLKIPQIMVVPYDLSKGNQSSMNMDGYLPAGMVQRYFVRIPAGTNEFDMALRVPQLNKTYMGKVRVQIFDPMGWEEVRTGYAGYGESSGDGTSQVYASIDQPMAGVWEIVVYSSVTLSLYNDDASEYNINFSLSNIPKVSYTANDKYLVGYVPAAISGSEILTLQIRNSKDLKPYSGFVMVNDKQYFVKDGSLQLTRPPVNTHIYLTW